MPDLTTRAGKGSALTHNELDANFKRTVSQKTTNYTLLTSDNRNVIECNHASTPFTITLPDAATVAADDTGDWEVTITNINAAAVTVARAGTDTIDGAATSLTIDQNEAVTLAVNSAGSGFVTIASPFMPAERTKLEGIETAATADQTAAEIRTLVESATDSNVFTDADHTKLNGIATGAEVNPDVVSQAEAEAGTATTERIWTAERVKQAIVALGAPLIEEGATATTSGQTVSLSTSIPSWAKRVTVIFNNVTVATATGELVVRIGDSGGIETTGYNSSSHDVTAASNATSSSGFHVLSATIGTEVFGRMVLENVSGNVWIASGVIHDDSAGDHFVTNGAKTLTGTLDRVDIDLSGSATFSAGEANVFWE